MPKKLFPHQFKIAGFSISRTALLVILVFAALAGYVLSKAVAFGYAVFVLLIAAFASELLAPPAKGRKQGWKESAKELFVTALAALVLWFALGFVLQTSSPLNVVTSCSMVPVLERGDFVILQGAELNAPTARIDGNAEKASYRLSFIRGQTLLSKAFVLPYLGDEPVFVPYFKGCEKRYSDGRAEEGDCLDFISVGGLNVSANPANDVIVYDPVPAQYGPIIHRVLARLEASDGVYYLTWGDNNALADQMTGIRLVPAKDVKGKVVLRIPYLGYLKLFLFMQFEEPAGCNFVIEK